MRAGLTVLYHGTDPATAKILELGGISLRKGTGEFGVGFYMGTSRRLAKRRAFHRSELILGSTSQALQESDRNTLVLVFDQDFEKTLRSHRLDRRRSIELYRRLSRRNTQRTYRKWGFDILIGAIVGTMRYLDVTQVKFQSRTAERLVNGQIWFLKPKRSLV